MLPPEQQESRPQNIGPSRCSNQKSNRNPRAHPLQAQPYSKMPNEHLSPNFDYSISLAQIDSPSPNPDAISTPLNSTMAETGGFQFFAAALLQVG
jgi:hypothetical protein